MESAVCTKRLLVTPPLQAWAKRLGETAGHMHRKVWEWCFICEARRERGMLKAGKSGLGCGVGDEPLASMFASCGATVLATDLHRDAANVAGWTRGAQHASTRASLNRRKLCPSDLFEQRVAFESADMNAIPARYHGRFDFVWSAGALAHLGSLEKGVRFVLESARCLKPGGIAAHTTDFNVSSNGETIEEGGTVLYRRRDLEGLIARVWESGCAIEMDWSLGDAPEDYHVDVAPYAHDVHLKLKLGKYTVTSVGLVVTR